MRSKSFLSFFRALFPSWKFFDTESARYAVYYRMKTPTTDWGSWVEVLPYKAPTGARFFLNARGNERMAFLSIVDELLANAQNVNTKRDAHDLSKQVPYLLLLRLVQEKMPRSERLPENQIEFKICEVSGSPPMLAMGGELIISKTHGAA